MDDPILIRASEWTLAVIVAMLICLTQRNAAVARCAERRLAWRN